MASCAASSASSFREPPSAVGLSLSEMGPAKSTRNTSKPPDSPTWLVVNRELLDASATLKGLRGCPIRWNEAKKKNAKKISGVVIKEEGQPLVGIRVLARYAEEHVARAPRLLTSAAKAAVIWFEALSSDSATAFGALAAREDDDLGCHVSHGHRLGARQRH